MSKLEFFGMSMRDGDNIAANPARLVNLYREPIVGAGGAVLKSVLATASFAPMDIAFGQAVASVNGGLYAVADGAAYSISNSGMAVSFGALPQIA